MDKKLLCKMMISIAVSAFISGFLSRRLFTALNLPISEDFWFLIFTLVLMIPFFIYAIIFLKRNQTEKHKLTRKEKLNLAFVTIISIAFASLMFFLASLIG